LSGILKELRNDGGETRLAPLDAIGFSAGWFIAAAIAAAEDKEW